jgi:hypothetical protein
MVLGTSVDVNVCVGALMMSFTAVGAVLPPLGKASAG